MSHTLIKVNREYVTADRAVTELLTKSCFNADMSTQI